MRNITAEYLLLFNAITDAELTLARLREELIFAQRRAEELYLEEEAEGDAGAGERPTLLPPAASPSRQTAL